MSGSKIQNDHYCMTIICHQDCVENNLYNLEKWGMRFNGTKCYILSVKKSSSYFYKLGNTVLKEVENNSYLGLSISNDLKLTNHINNIRRNLRHNPVKCLRTAYVSLIRSTLECVAVIWDLFLQSDIHKIERVQHKAAHFISGDYKSRDRGYVTRMFKNVELPLLEERRKQLTLTFMFKVVEGLIPAIPASKYFEPVQNKRKIRATRYKDCESTNIVSSHELKNSKCFNYKRCNTTIYNNFFFVRTVHEWDQLEDSIISGRFGACLSLATPNVILLKMKPS